MKPLWIIDIREGRHPRLEECLAFINQQKNRYWLYSKPDIGHLADLHAYAKACNRLLEEARTQINLLLQQSGLNANTFPVCVLGDVTSEQTRSFLPFVSILLKRNWAKVLPASVSTGVSVGTFIYIPTDANQHEADKQRKYAAFLEELSLLHEQTPAETYEFIVTYGDIQPIGKQVYSLLGTEQRDELLFQYLLNLYHTGSSEKLPIIPPGGSKLFCNLGAASCFYDADYTRKQMAGQVMTGLLELFRKKREEIASDSDLLSRMQAETERLFKAGFTTETENKFMTSSSILSFIACNEADITVDLKNMEKEEGLHPIFHFWKPLLYPTYYLRELKYLPARLNEYLQFYVQSLRQRITLHLQGNKTTLLEKTRQVIDNLLVTFWEGTDYKYKTLDQVEQFLRKIIDSADAESKRLKLQATAQSVSPVVIPQFLQPHVEEIKNSQGDITLHNILDELKATLQKEPTFLGAMMRCVLVGTSGIFCILPLLKFLSPRIINLGEVTLYEPVWIALIYLLPFVYTLWWIFRRHFRLVKSLKNKLWAFVLYQLKEQMANKLVEESLQYYDLLKEYCEEKLSDCGRLREAYKAASIAVESNRFMKTFFNRPIDEFIPDKSLVEERIEVEGHEYVNAAELTENHLYYLLAKSISEVGNTLFAPLPKEANALNQKVGQDVAALLESVQKNFVRNENRELHQLIKHCSHAFDWHSCIALAYPVGIFVGTVSQDEQCIIRTAHGIISPNTLQADWEIDADGEPNMMFATVFKHVNKLLVSRFLDEEAVKNDLTTDLTIELACYYAFYDGKSKQAGRIGTRIVRNERLREIDNVLSNREDLT